MTRTLTMLKARHMTYVSVVLAGLFFVVTFAEPGITLYRAYTGYRIEQAQGVYLQPPPKSQTALRIKELEAELLPAPDLSFSPSVASVTVPYVIKPVYVKSVPDLSSLKTQQRKEHFIALVLPLILRANQELDQRLQRIESDYRAGFSDRLRLWAELYAFDSRNLTDHEIYAELRLRVRPVPAPIALAQAVVESGWGTSRFTKEGNALYGQWAWSSAAGIKPEQSRYEDAVIRAFPSLFDSVRAYMHNLNTHEAYQRFRETRNLLINVATKDRVLAVTKTLDQYSETGLSYTYKLLDIMDDNDLWIYDRSRLAVVSKLFG